MRHLSRRDELVVLLSLSVAPALFVGRIWKANASATSTRQQQTMQPETSDETCKSGEGDPARVERDGRGARSFAEVDRHAGRNPGDHREDRRADADENALGPEHKTN